MYTTYPGVLLGAYFALGAPVTLAAAPHPAQTAPTASYQSAFEGFRSHREEPIADWRAVNEDVARAGGHIGIMRNTPVRSAPAAAAPKAPPAPAAHSH